MRGDILYGFPSPRAQAGIDLVLYVAFFLPGVAALVWAGYTFAADSWAIDEHSSITASGPLLYPFKTVIPVAGAVLLLQGLVEIVRCVLCLIAGQWPPREGPAPGALTNGHLGLLMLSLIVVSIMLGFPTAFTLMGMRVVFTYLAYRSVDPDSAVELTLSLMVYRAYAVMSNEVLIAIPLFVFMAISSSART